MRDIRVATVQFQHAAGDKAYNFGRVRHFVTEAARARVEMIAFPEMCLTGYWHVRKLSRAAFEALAEPVPDGPSTRDLLDLSREHGMTIGAGLLERAPDGGVYNAYVVAMPDGAWAVHRKLHVFEHPNICAGNRYTVFDTPHGCRVGVLICYDNNIVENARATALLGADMVVADLDASVLPTSSGRRWLRARRPELYESLARPTGQEQETRRVRFGE